MNEGLKNEKVIDFNKEREKRRGQKSQQEHPHTLDSGATRSLEADVPSLLDDMLNIKRPEDLPQVMAEADPVVFAEKLVEFLDESRRNAMQNNFLLTDNSDDEDRLNAARIEFEGNLRASREELKDASREELERIMGEYKKRQTVAGTPRAIAAAERYFKVKE